MVPLHVVTLHASQAAAMQAAGMQAAAAQQDTRSACLLLQGPDIQIKAQNHITLQNAQELVLWILANGVATAPKWAMVQVSKMHRAMEHSSSIRGSGSTQL